MSLDPKVLEDVYPLSPVQQGLLFHHLYAPGDGVYLDQVVLPLAGPLDLAAFAGAWRAVVARHAALRTSFHWQDLEKPLQAVHRAVRLPVAVIDGRHLAPASDRDDFLAGVLAADRRHGVDLARPPLSRLTVVRLGDRDHRVVWSYHHLLLDAWSGSILFREVFVLYQAALARRPAELPPPVPFRRYARWLKQQDPDAATAFWREELAGVTDPTPLPADGSEGGWELGARSAHERNGATSPPAVEARGEVTADLAAATGEALRRFAREHRLTLNTLVQGAWALALGRSSGQAEVVFGATVSGRPPDLAGVESIVGMLVNTLPVRVPLPPEAEVAAWLGELQARQMAQRRFEASSLAEVQSLAGCGAGRPLFESILAFENVPGAELATARQRDADSLAVDEPRYLFRTHYPLTAQVLPGETLRFRLAFDPARLSVSAAARFLGRVTTILEALPADAHRPLAALPALAAAERQMVLAEWSGGATPYPRETTVDRLVAAWVAATPDAVALTDDGETLSYGGLAARARRLARALERQGVGPEVRVGVAVERSLDLLATLLAIVQAGGVYVPLDPDLPRERLAFLAAEAEVAVVLARPGEAARLPTLPQHLGAVPLVDPAARFAAADEEPLSSPAPVSRARPENLIYVLFTSGSTGQPKGVAVPHRGVVRLVAGNPFVRFGPGETFFHAAPVSFDASTFEIWGALAHGSRLVVARPGLLGLDELGGLLDRHRVTTLWVTTGLFHQLAEHRPETFAELSQVLMGGEAARTAHVDRMLRASPPGLRLFNGYGPTECTTFATGDHFAGGVGLDVARPVPIGRAIANTRILVLDGGGRPVPVGAPGELLLGGDGLARGYLRRPALTAARFVPDALATAPGSRLYRTGDQVRFLPDGRLVFLGRLDQQVKIRGFRIEPAEIEAVLLVHPLVKAGLVMAREDRPGDLRLVAYVVPEPSPAPEELRSFLRDYLGERLPGYMVPAVFVALPALPLTANGKVDRRALPAPELAAGAQTRSHRPPANDLEAELSRLWAHLLGVPAVGPDDDFFDLGGHSLHATQLVSQVRRTFGVEVPLRTVFEQPTVAGLAAAIQAGTAPAATSPGSGTPGGAASAGTTVADAPLSFAQERLWFLDRLEPGLTAYNVPFALALAGALDTGALRRALATVVARHAVLRSRLVEIDGFGFQRAEPAAPLALPEIDLAGCDAAAEAAARAIAGRELRLPFDLARGPLLRARLLRLAPRRFFLLLTLHHIVSDGWSMGVLLDEATQLYAAYAAGQPSPLPPLAIQYADFAVWQRELLAGPELDRQLGYWKRQLADLPPALDLPYDRPRPAVQTYRGGQRTVELSPRLTAALGELATRQRVTLFMVLLTGFGELLARHAGSRDVAVGTAVANRNRAETEGLIGFFVNTLVLRLALGGDPEVRQALARVRETTLGAYAHQDLPFERLVAEVGGQRNLAVTPLFQVLFVLQNTPLAERQVPGLTITPVEIESGLTKFDLQLTLASRGERIAGALEYNTDLFDATTAERLVRHLERVLAGMVAAPSRRLSALPVLGREEMWQLVGEWSQGEEGEEGDKQDPPGGRRSVRACDARPLADAALLGATAAGSSSPGEEEIWLGGAEGLLQGGFLAQAARIPDAVAVVCGEERVSYGELAARAATLAERLIELGVGPEVRVGVALDRTPDLLVALLATLLAGGAYVPLDLTYPRERLAFMLEDSAAAVLLTTSQAAAAIPHGEGLRVLSVHPGGRVLGAGAPEPAELAPRNAASPEASNLAYVIYTSGSTGRPKGVAIAHASAVTLLDWARREFPPATLAGTLAATSVCFDLSIFELFLPLAAGAKVILVPNALRLAELPGAAEVTLVNTVPSAMAELVASGGVPASVRTVNLAGEPLKPALVAALYRLAGVERVYNLYGPSEDTTYSTFAVIPRDGEPHPAIGRPIAGSTAFVLGPDRRPVPLGVPGELYLGGRGLARGYLGQPGLTAARFVPDPFAATGATGGRLYRTGDLVRLRTTGALDFLGRLDHQVKTRGYRIELGEIEAVLAAHPAVRQAVVTAREDLPGDARLVAYLVCEGESSELRGYLLERLPSYMVPTAFVTLPSLPLTPSGKIDRRALPAPTGERPAVEADFIAPRTATERAIAAVWCEVLGLARVGVRDNFFELGGHSLLLMRVQARLGAALGTALPMIELFSQPTIEALARRLDATAPAAAGFEHSSERAERKRAELAARRPRAAGRGR